jgi:hypothetical protein
MVEGFRSPHGFLSVREITCALEALELVEGALGCGLCGVECLRVAVVD